MNTNAKSKRRTFTLIELLMVIGVIIILAGIAMPNFYKAKEKALTKEAIINLKLIAAAERIYRMENNTFYPANGTESILTNINTNLKLMLSGTNWTHSITTTLGPPPTFIITGGRVGTDGYLDCVYTLTDTDVDGEPNASVACP